jgi:hypothetical protein
MTRHEGANVNCSSPEVVVLSKYVPSALAVNVPVTCRDPVTGAVGHPAPNDAKSRLPVTFRHDDVTVQVPTTMPPQGVTLGQDPPAPPLPDFAPVPDEPPRLELHPPRITPKAIAIARAADWTLVAGPPDCASPLLA